MILYSATTAATKEQSTDIHSNIDESPNPDVEHK